MTVSTSNLIQLCASINIDHRDFVVIKDDLHIFACTELETLTLRCTLPACPCMTTLLSEVSSPHIRTVYIAISGDTLPTLPDCQGLADALDGANLRNLSDIFFIYGGTLEPQTVLDKIQADLPSIHHRGLLRIITPATAQIFENSGTFKGIFQGVDLQSLLHELFHPTPT